MSPGTWECVHLVPKKLRHGPLQFETRARTTLFLYQNHQDNHPRIDTYTNPYPCHRANPFWVINTFFPVLQFVTVILSHCIGTCTFTKVLFLPNFCASCSKCVTKTSSKLASSHYTACIVIIHIAAKMTP